MSYKNSVLNIIMVASLLFLSHGRLSTAIHKNRSTEDLLRSMRMRALEEQERAIQAANGEGVGDWKDDAGAACFGEWDMLLSDNTLSKGMVAFWTNVCEVTEFGVDTDVNIEFFCPQGGPAKVCDKAGGRMSPVDYSLACDVTDGTHLDTVHYNEPHCIGTSCFDPELLLIIKNSFAKTGAEEMEESEVVAKCSYTLF
eukprot:65589_1